MLVHIIAYSISIIMYLIIIEYYWRNNRLEHPYWTYTFLALACVILLIGKIYSKKYKVN